jgi:hypothetical protein
MTEAAFHGIASDASEPKTTISNMSAQQACANAA